MIVHNFLCRDGVGAAEVLISRCYVVSISRHLLAQDKFHQIREEIDASFLRRDGIVERSVSVLLEVEAAIDVAAPTNVGGHFSSHGEVAIGHAARSVLGALLLLGGCFSLTLGRLSGGSESHQDGDEQYDSFHILMFSES